jgi:serine/threonine-protein kinase
MGSIYVCRRAGEGGSQRLFTLKVVRQYSAQREEAVRSFKREAHVGSLLAHPNLQTVLDVGSYKDQPFLILDYIEGTSLSDLIADDRRAPVRVIVAILLDLLRGLERARTVTDTDGTPVGLVHGDVSPQNVLVGVDGVARLTDFGSASFKGEDKVVDSKRIATGKPAHMAPEQLRAEPLDARTDIFSTGVLMWNALTGQKLFAAESYDETIIKVLRKKIPPPSDFGCPPALDEICLKALSRSKEGRYATPDEMAKDLVRVASVENLLASSTEVGQWVRRESGDGLGELRRRIQLMFPSNKPLTGSPSAPVSSGRINTPMASARVNTPMASARVNTPMGRVSTPFASRPAAATVVLDAHKNVATPKLGANKVLPSRTIFLPDGPRRKNFWRTWNVVIVSALLALPVTLTIGYFVSNLLLYRPQPAPATPSNLVDAASQ